MNDKRAPRRTQDGELYSGRSAHHSITVEDKDGVRVMRFGGRLQSAADVETLSDARTPAQDYLHIPMALRPQAKRMLMIGLGGGILAKTMLRDYPELHIDVVEVDPVVVSVAQQYFDLPSTERLNIIIGDGREYLEGIESSYDIIILDALFEAYTPFCFATREYLQMVRTKVTHGGIYAHNANGYYEGPQSQTLWRYLRGIHDAFADVHVFGVTPVFNRDPGKSNLVVIASDTVRTSAEVAAAVRGRGGGVVSIEDFPRFADDLRPARTDWGGIGSLSDAEAPPDGLLHS